MNKKLDWKKVPVVLKRYSLFDKIYWSAFFARNICPQWRYDPDYAKEKIGQHPLPWNLNIFAMLSLANYEYDYQPMPRKRFGEIYNSISSAIPFDRSDDFESVMSHFVIGSQLHYQANVAVYLSRYYYMFTHNKLRLDKIVEERLNVPYKSLLSFAAFAWAIESNGENLIEVLNGLRRNKNIGLGENLVKAVDALTIERKEFSVRQLEKISKSPRGYLLADNLLEQYPFVKEGDARCLPLPYLIKSAVTSGLVKRIASGENVALRAEIGKEIVEEYLKDVVESSKSYDYVGSERLYNQGHDRSPDVIAYKDSKCVLFEMKFKEAPLSLRGLKPENEAALDNQCADAVEQVLKGVDNRAMYLRERNFEDDDVYGVVVFFEELNLSRARILEILLKRHPEWKTNGRLEFFKTHIRIVSLYDIEIVSFRGHTVFPVLEHYKEHSDEWMNRVLFDLDEKSDRFEIPWFQGMLDYGIDGFQEMIVER